MSAQKIETFVEKEKGQWVVYLEVTFWESERDFPLKTERHRIQAYRKQSQAEVAANWYQRAANRDLRFPPFG